MEPVTSVPVVVAGAGTSFSSLDIERNILAEVGAEVIDARHLPEAEIRAACVNADAILSDYFACDESLIASLTRCRVIGSYGVGYDQIDVTAANTRNIQVTNNPEYCVDEMAEHTIAMLLAAWRRIPAYDRHVRGGGWDYASSPAPRRLRGATLGVVGFGRIGRAVAALGTGLGMRVIVHDPYLVQAQADAELMPLDELLSAADVVTLHLPLSPATRGLLGAEQIAMIDRHSGVINTARGALIDDEALAAALREDRLAWAAIDAFDPEPPLLSHPLLSAPNVVLSPHAGFYSSDSLIAAQTNAAQEVLRVLRGDAPLHPVGTATREGIR
ncbi:C-terminal binding protein [Parafrigoribacterium humi]|uniref:C-terminal binding protein n=1 Tax=Parafrigoribacterium humi TaxID=3144664 RepID=UPI0032ED2BC3